MAFPRKRLRDARPQKSNVVRHVILAVFPILTLMACQEESLIGLTPIHTTAPTVAATQTPAPTMTPTPTMSLTPSPIPEEIVLVAAGDTASCENDNDELTAQLLDQIPGTVLALGDNAYPSGTLEDYLNCYEPTWGRHKDRTKPIPGNHDYLTLDADGYFVYFDEIEPYYAYDLGNWRIYALNSEIDVSPRGEQLSWLRNDLAAHPSRCTLAYWHQPRWSSGSHHDSQQNYEDYQALWQLFYETGAELVLSAHEHHYERFAEMNAEGKVTSPGLRQIVVGTGGRSLYEFGRILPASQVRNGFTYGVLKLTLRTDGYDWEFIPVAGSNFTDRGSTNCH
jgi:acid phosphatase type 7